MDSNTRLHSCQVLPKKKPDEFSDPQASLDIDKLVSCGYREGQLRVIFRFFIFDHYQLTPLKIRIGGRKRVEKMTLISLEECCGSESQKYLISLEECCGSESQKYLLNIFFLSFMRVWRITMQLETRSYERSPMAKPLEDFIHDLQES